MKGCLVSFSRPLAYLITIALFPVIRTWNVENEIHYNSGIVIRTDDRTRRVLSIEAIVDMRDPIPNQSVTEEVKTHFQKSAEPGDVMGFYIDSRIGGPANETFNVVPMNPSVSELWRTNVSEPIYQKLKEDTETRQGSFVIHPLYGDMNTTRPDGFIIVAMVMRRPNVTGTNNKFNLVVKGYIPNPPKAMISKALEPALYSTDRWDVRHWERGTSPTTMSGTSHIASTVKGIQSEEFERTEMGNFAVTMENGVIVQSCGAEDSRQTQFRKSAWKDDDVPGFLLSQRLGGCLEDPYNVVPMSPKAVEEYKSKLEEPIIDFLNTTVFTYKPPSPDGETPPRFVLTTLIVVYPEPLATRPAGFFFRSIRGPLVVVGNLYIPN
uniref:Uncharacterized protein n=1 Tax=Lygus hesperus TaxID=30085 RepID=A0A146LZN5_LYGHE